MTIRFDYDLNPLDPENFKIEGVYQIREYAVKIYISTLNKQKMYGKNGFRRDLIRNFKVEIK